MRNLTQDEMTNATTATACEIIATAPAPSDTFVGWSSIDDEPQYWSELHVFSATGQFVGALCGRRDGPLPDDQFPGDDHEAAIRRMATGTFLAVVYGEERQGLRVDDVYRIV